MKKLLVIIMMAMMPGFVWAQHAPFAPAQDQPGTTAMHADSSAFIGWATGCVAEPGPMNITNPSAGVAGAGYPAENAIGVPDGTYGVTCLGDGGWATVTFASPICNREGPDFAVFENGFKSGTQWFLEIAFVEVSSDGENFFRFPAVTYVQYETQLGGFATMDPAYIHNFAGKYGAFYGTPFDLDEVPDDSLLDKENVTHVRIVDVIGNIDPAYCTYDSQGHPVNDPWPTPFASSGFDLDAVGVIHDIEHFPTPTPPPTPPTTADATIAPLITLYPNPAVSYAMLQVDTEATVTIADIHGRVINTFAVNGNELVRIETEGYKAGIYFVTVSNDVSRQTIKLFVN